MNLLIVHKNIWIITMNQLSTLVVIIMFMLFFQFWLRIYFYRQNTITKWSWFLFIYLTHTYPHKLKYFVYWSVSFFCYSKKKKNSLDLDAAGPFNVFRFFIYIFRLFFLVSKGNCMAIIIVDKNKNRIVLFSIIIESLTIFFCTVYKHKKFQLF